MSFRRTCSVELFGLLDSNAHAYRLYIFNDPPAWQLPLPRFVCLAAISEALNYDTVSCILSQHPEEFFLQDFEASPLASSVTWLPVAASQKSKRQTPSLLARREGACQHKSLTMTYFHTGICTIIGAKSFHGPVRDGKEWDQLAMVVRHNGVLC